MENYYSQNTQLHVRVLFRARGGYQLLWRVYTIQDTFDMYNKGDYGFTYLAPSCKSKVSQHIKNIIESYECGSAPILINDTCISTGDTKMYKLNIEVLVNEKIMRRLKMENIISRL
jgi:hypothetical protein